MRPVLLFGLPAFLAVVLALPAEEKPAAGKPLFNGKDLSGWKLRDPKAADRSKWSVIASLKLKDGMSEQFVAEKGEGVLLNGGDGHGVDLLTETTHGDCELHVEFNVSKGSNS